jgi:hypothetical protein
MKEKLVKALEEGLILGVKYSVVILVTLFAAMQILTIRQAAFNGQLAYEYIAKAQAAQAKGVSNNGEATK